MRMGCEFQLNRFSPGAEFFQAWQLYSFSNWNSLRLCFHADLQQGDQWGTKKGYKKTPGQFIVQFPGVACRSSSLLGCLRFLLLPYDEQSVQSYSSTISVAWICVNHSSLKHPHLMGVQWRQTTLFPSFNTCVKTPMWFPIIFPCPETNNMKYSHYILYSAHLCK